MTPQEKIKNIIRNRPCFVVAKGASIVELQSRINEFKDLDVCWITTNDFPYIEQSILNKISKRFELVSDCGTVLLVNSYEQQVRIPRFTEFLGRLDNNLLMLSNLVIQQCFIDQKREDLYEQYKDKIISIDDLFNQPDSPAELFAPPPNSITLLFAFLIAGGAKKIILFGLDGFQDNVSALNSYFMPERVVQERFEGYGDSRDGSLRTDTHEFNRRWKDISALYQKTYDNLDVKFYNCSPITSITTFPIITYQQVKNIL